MDTKSEDRESKSSQSSSEDEDYLEINNDQDFAAITPGDSNV